MTVLLFVLMLNSITIMFSCKKCNTKKKYHELSLDLAARLIEYRLCVECYYFYCLVLHKNKQQYKFSIIIINGKHYSIGSSKSKEGKKYVIFFRDGTQLTTYDLRLHSIVPKRWQKVLPNNARFIKVRGK